jgi:hypothetical protein
MGGRFGKDSRVVAGESGQARELRNWRRDPLIGPKLHDEFLLRAEHVAALQAGEIAGATVPFGEEVALATGARF